MRIIGSAVLLAVFFLATALQSSDAQQHDETRSPGFLLVVNAKPVSAEDDTLLEGDKPTDDLGSASLWVDPMNPFEITAIGGP
jgi:hypothetical protein